MGERHRCLAVRSGREVEVGLVIGNRKLLSQCRELLRGGLLLAAHVCSLAGGDCVSPPAGVEEDVDVVGEGHLELGQAVWTKGDRGEMVSLQ